MNEQDWAPEPLELLPETATVIDANGKVIAFTRQDIETIKRAVACYNACAGIPTEVLLTLNVKKLIEQESLFGKVLEQSEKVLKMLEDKEAADGHERTPEGD